MHEPFIYRFKPLSFLLPEVKKPIRKISLFQRLVYTLICIIIFLIMSSVPLYGYIQPVFDPFWNFRFLFGSTRGTLMELGVIPLITSTTVFMLLVSSDIIAIDKNISEERILSRVFYKILTICIIIFTTIIYVVTDIIDPPTILTTILIIIQIISAEIILFYMVELIESGWGIGEGITIFQASSISTILMIKLFSFVPMTDNNPYGIIPAIIKIIINKENFETIYIRYDYPSIIGLFFTIILFLLILYLSSCRIELPISSINYKGYRGRLPIRFFYLDEKPILYTTNFFLWFLIISSILFKLNISPPNWMIDVVSIIAIRDSSVILEKPIIFMIYSIFFIIITILFSYFILEIQGGTETMANDLLKSGMQIPGFRRDPEPIKKLLDSYITSLLPISAFTMAILTLTSNITQSFIKGTEILVIIPVFYKYYQTLIAEQVENLYPFLDGAFGDKKVKGPNPDLERFKNIIKLYDYKSQQVKRTITIERSNTDIFYKKNEIYKREKNIQYIKYPLNIRCHLTGKSINFSFCTNVCPIYLDCHKLKKLLK